MYDGNGKKISGTYEENIRKYKKYLSEIWTKLRKKNLMKFEGHMRMKEEDRGKSEASL